ncbi:MAG: nucleoside-diphosphate kinase [Candidatus Woesearchaeota archaeon]
MVKKNPDVSEGSPKSKIERTLILIKSDGVQRQIVGKIIQRLEDAGLKIVGMKMKWVDSDFAKKHYFDVEERKGPRVFQSLVTYLTEGPVVAMVIEGIDSVELVRKMVGPTEPKSAMPGTIRGDFAQHSYSFADEREMSIRNLIHASGKSEEAKYEIALWFKPDELHTYKTVHEVHVF